MAADRVRASGATIVMLALGQPLQEQWLARHLPATGARVGLAVGGFLDFVWRVWREPTGELRIGSV